MSPASLRNSQELAIRTGLYSEMGSGDISMKLSDLKFKEILKRETRSQIVLFKETGDDFMHIT